MEKKKPDTPAYGLFGAKLDASEITIEKLHDILPTLEMRLLVFGFGIYRLYTRLIDRK